jgi:hypothetical protein
MLNIRNELVSVYRRSHKILRHVAGTDFPFNQIPPRDLEEIIVHNRRALAQIGTWLDQETLKRSIFNYGITPQFLPRINGSPDGTCTYADLLVYFMKRLRGPVRYLELGVSVGKTFWQILCASKAARLTGFDIEAINPALERELQQETRREWPSMPGSIKKTPASLTSYRHPPSGSKVDYLCGDIFDDDAWQALKGTRFNLILSDAFHSADAVQKEWEAMSLLDLFDKEECVIVWDDLDGPMHDWFLRRRTEIAGALGVDRTQVRTVFVNGWMGEQEWPHRIGLAVKTL